MNSAVGSAARSAPSEAAPARARGDALADHAEFQVGQGEVEVPVAQVDSGEFGVAGVMASADGSGRWSRRRRFEDGVEDRVR